MLFWVSACSYAVGFLRERSFDEGGDCLFYMFGGFRENFNPVHRYSWIHCDI